MILFGALFSGFVPGRRETLFLREPWFWHGLLFTTIFNVAVVYAIVTVPDWMWMYYLEDSRNSLSELIYLFVFLYYLPYVLGYYLGRDLRGRSFAVYVLFLLFLAASELWVVLHLFDRYSVVGTRDQYLSGTAPSLFSPENPIATVMNACVGLMVVHFLFVLYLYRRRPRLH